LPFLEKNVNLTEQQTKMDILPDSTRILQKIEEALTQIRPYLQADGGDVSLLEVTPDMIVKLELQGACKSCAMSAMTMKAGIEEAIKRAVPEIKGVEAVNRVPEFNN
jgi:Fe-S cluster biogenesis protein NfuA